MRRPRITVALAVALAFASFIASSPTHACGGGLVSAQAGAVANAQRIVLALGVDRTEVITQVVVPQSATDYGVLIPLPARPEIDPQPVSTRALDTLDRNTSPLIIMPGGDDGGGCQCPASGSDSVKGGIPGRGVMVTDPVEIGPVTAVSLTADTGEAVSGWLTDNGFALPADGRALLDRYAGPGRWFVAIRRSQQATGPQPSSVGLHFSVPGDARALPLRFAALGAAAEVAFTVFVVSPRPSGPNLPFEGLTLDRLDRTLVATGGYRAAVKKAIADRRGQALVIETVRPIGADGLPAELRGLVTFGAEPMFLTRLTTVLDASALTQDAPLDGPAPESVPTTIVLSAGERRSATPLFATLLGAAALVGRTGRRVTGRRSGQVR